MTTFIGREAELDVLAAAWRAEEVRVVVLQGEPGIGKTRIATEFTEIVRAAGGHVLWGTCYEGGSWRPYGVWAEAFAGHLGQVSPAEARWLAPLLPATEAVPLVAAHVGQVRLAEVLTHILDASERPPVVVLDDMHWAPPESLELFRHVACHARHALFVVITRETPLGPRHPLRSCLADVRRHQAVEYLRPESMSREESGMLLTTISGRPLDTQLMTRLYADSGGNPFFLAELGRHLRRTPESGTGYEPAADLPGSIQSAVTSRVTRLGAETRHALQLAAIFTSGFAFSELQELTGLDEDTLLDALDEALGESLLRSLGAERYDFAHALIRHTLYSGLSPSRRARLHRRLAEALERLYAAHPAQVAGELVRQYHASAALPGAGRGAEFALTAAAVARAAAAPSAAIVSLRLGLDLAGADDTVIRSRLLGELAVAETEAGHFADAVGTLRAAVSEMSSPEEIAAVVYRVGQLFSLAPTGVPSFQPFVTSAAQALGGTRGLPWARLKLLRWLAEPHRLGPIQVTGWRALDPDATRIAREIGDEADYAFTLDSWAPWFGREVDQVITAVDQWQDSSARLQALIVVTGYLSLYTFGDHPAAERLGREFAALADDVGLPLHRTLARLFEAARVARDGRLADATVLLAQARELMVQDPASAAIGALVILVEVLTTQHLEADWPALAASLYSLATGPRQIADTVTIATAALSAVAYARAGDADRAREIIGYLMSELQVLDPLMSSACGAFGLVAEAIWELRDTGLAEQLLPTALSLAVPGSREFYMTSSELTVARLSWLCGRQAQAAEYFGRARKTLADAGHAPLGVIVDRDAEMAGQLSAPAPHAPAVPYAQAPDGLTARETQILILVARRRTNKEIAGELVLSVHTVERHVQNLYRKIGVTNRGQAGEYAIRIGLIHSF